MMENGNLIRGLKCLRGGTPGAEALGQGFSAFVRFDCASESMEREILSDIFHAEWRENGGLLCHLVNNAGEPIEFPSFADAVANAYAYFNGMEKKYQFECFRMYRVKLDIPKETVVTFIKRNQK